MLKDKKLDYQKQLEEYLEEQKVYDIFEDMMKALIIAKPENPIPFLLKKLTSPESNYLHYHINSILLICSLNSKTADNSGSSRKQEEGDRIVPD